MTVHSALIVAEINTQLLPTLLRLVKLVRNFHGLRLAEIGLRSGQDEFLLALASGEERSVSDMAAQLSVRASTVSKMADILEAKGLISRVEGTNDLRKTYIRLTAGGVATCRRIVVVWDRLEAELMPAAVRAEDAALRCELSALQNHVATRLARLR